MKAFISVLCCLLLLTAQAEAQTVTLQPKAGELPAFIDENGDTIPYIYLPSITIVSKRTFKGKRDEQRFNRLYANVLKVYPIAKAAGNRLRQLEGELAQMPERKHKAHIKKTEDDLKKEYKQQLLNLTITQGKILIKLIDRETSRTSYDLIKDFRGNFQAFMWQSLAGLFGTNLKTGYDLQEDRDIEFILQQIEGENYRPPVRDQPH